MEKKINFLLAHTEQVAMVNERFQPLDEIDLRVEEIKRNGYTILEDRVSEEDLKFLRETIDEYYEVQLREIGGQEKLAEIGDENNVKQLLAYDDRFLKFAVQEEVIQIVKRLVGDYFHIRQQSGNIIRPHYANTTAPWHRDLTYQHYTSSRPLAISTLYCVDDFTEENGGIDILPGSHLHESFPSFEFVEKYQRKIPVKAGSIWVFDSMLFHRSGYNRSNQVRRSLNHVYVVRMIQQQISLPRLLKGKYSDDPFLRGLLGYDCETAGSVLEWRKEKLRSKRKTFPQENQVVKNQTY